jgi:ATP-dependent DNA helicase PIF1
MDSMASLTSALPKVSSASASSASASLPPVAVFSEEQTVAMELYAKGKNLFLTGPGGTGKSFLIQKMIEHAKATKKSCCVCALTGCAAVLLGCNATTIHSWSGIGTMNGLDEDVIRRLMKKPNVKDSWRTDILIVDEVSMMTRRMFELLNKIGQLVRKNKAPFGGIQVIFVGDFFQLPPVEKDGFCFESSEWFEVFPKSQHLELKTFFRQVDPVYIDILMKVRKGALDKASIAILEKYVARDRDQPITKIVPTRKQADFINQTMFDKIAEPARTFDALVHKNLTMNINDGKNLDIYVIRRGETLSEQEKDREIDTLLKNHNFTPKLELKLGAQVMCTRNLSVETGIINGSQGVIVEFVKERPVVLFANGRRMMMERVVVQSDVYPTLAIEQYPLSWAWALTIHKIQGCSLTHAQIDIGNSIFEYGQTYVALSRVRTMDGLYLMNFQPNRIKSNPKVIAFYDSL